MLRSFHARDLFFLRAQQASGVSLALEADILDGASPLRHALAACCSPRPRPVRTLVLQAADAQAPEGYLQLRAHRHGPAVDLCHIGPDLSAAPGVAHAWTRLVSGGAQWLGERGIQRLHVALPDDATVALQIFRQLGFAALTGDTLFRLDAADAARPGDPAASLTLVPEAERHQPALERLARAALPTGANLPPDAADCAWRSYPLGGWLPGRAWARVWLGARGQTLGAVRMLRGPAGWWLHALADEKVDPEPLLRQALAEAADRDSGAPVYAAARDGDLGLDMALRGLGFKVLGGRFRLVKALTRYVREPAWRERPLIEAAAEPAATLPARAPASWARARVAGTRPRRARLPQPRQPRPRQAQPRQP